MLHVIVCILINIYFAMAFFRAGYTYCEIKIVCRETGNKCGMKQLIDSMVFGFYGPIMIWYHKVTERIKSRGAK